ncbi:MAG TPA: gamma-glutamyltransferase, partial [Actinomycetota bacterium]|nr:gamma-glutamyltransferase [Actinomycetota bacterium]
MTQPHLGIAAGSRLGCRAAEKVARSGGNAVDAALASAITAWVAEPFFASLGGSGFVAVRTPDGAVEVIDGNNMMPHTPPEEPGQGMKRIFLPDYADGIYMGIGGGSIAVPGILAAVRTAWERHGRIEWEALFSDAIDVARSGFPFPKTSDYYLSCTWGEIWSKYEGARSLFYVDGRPMREKDTLLQPELAEVLREIATKGPDVFYKGEIGNDIAESIAKDEGFLTLDDLNSFETEIRGSISTTAFGWLIESNPPPSVGG